MESAEKDFLLAKLFTGDLASAESSQLLEECRSNPDLLDEIAALLETERALHALNPTENLSNDFIQEALARLELDESKTIEFSKSVTAKLNKPNRSWVRWTLPIAAALIIGVIGFGLQYSEKSENSPAIARIISLEGVPRDSSTLPSVGDSLKPGLFELPSGFAQMRFNHGTVLLAEGPTSFEIVDDMHVMMHYGRATATVPPAGQGFTIESPVAEIIDLGTQFGVDVNPQGITEVHVMQGLVKARSKQTEQFTEIAENQALQVDGDNSKSAIADPARFLRQLPDRESQNNPNFLRWSFDEVQGEAASVSSQGLGSADNAGKLMNHHTPGDRPQWVPGVFGNALAFDGQGDYLQTNYRGISNNHPRTIAFWVKAPENNQANGYSIIGYGAWELGRAWQISLNPIIADGPLGRIRLGTKDAEIIGQTDLRDGRWHHVAVVLYPGPDVNLATNVLIYLNGEIETTSRKSIAIIDTQTDENSFPVIMGSSANFKTSGPSWQKHRFFEGSIDEMHIFDVALSQEQIQALMATNRIE